MLVSAVYIIIMQRYHRTTTRSWTRGLRCRHFVTIQKPLRRLKDLLAVDSRKSIEEGMKGRRGGLRGNDISSSHDDNTTTCLCGGTAAAVEGGYHYVHIYIIQVHPYRFIIIIFQVTLRPSESQSQSFSYYLCVSNDCLLYCQTLVWCVSRRSGLVSRRNKL